MANATVLPSHRAVEQAQRPAQPLPDAVRNHLGELVTELNGIATVLRTDITDVDHNDTYSAVAAWVARIAHDLGEMEIAQWPLTDEEAKWVAKWQRPA